MNALGVELLPAVPTVGVTADTDVDRIERIDKELLREAWNIQRGESDTAYVDALARLCADRGCTRNEAKDLFWFVLSDQESVTVTPDEFIALHFDRAVRQIGRRTHQRPTIVIEPPEHKMVDAAAGSLRNTDNLFQRANALCRIQFGAPLPDGSRRDADAPSIEVVSNAALQEILSERAFWVRRTNAGVRDSFVPQTATQLVQARTTWPVPTLMGIVESPVIRPDGSTLVDKGYDEATGLFLTKQYQLPQLTIKESRAALEYVVRDFPFKSEADKAAWIAYVLTAFARSAYAGCVPFWLFLANIRGCGKTLLCDAAAMIVTGRPMLRIPVPNDNDEWRKRITAIIMEGSPQVLFDNIPTGSTLQSAALDAALTATTWSDRILGRSEMVKAPVLWTPAGSGNNISVGGDLGRRTQLCRLESPLENPESRRDFKEKDLLGYVRANRLQLIAACLTVLRHYIVADQPDQKLPAFGSFQEWSDLVRSAIVYTGWPDPCEANASLGRLDFEGELLRSLVAGWQEADRDGHGMTVAEAYRRSATVNERGESAYPTLKNVLASLPPNRDLNRALGQRYMNSQLWTATDAFS
jgi:hypothetical protein